MGREEVPLMLAAFVRVCQISLRAESPSFVYLQTIVNCYFFSFLYNFLMVLLLIFFFVIFRKRRRNIRQGKSDPAVECIIKTGHAVRCENQDTYRKNKTKESKRGA